MRVLYLCSPPATQELIKVSASSAQQIFILGAPIDSRSADLLLIRTATRQQDARRLTDGHPGMCAYVPTPHVHARVKLCIRAYLDTCLCEVAY